MIIYRKEPYPLQMKNIMLLDEEITGGIVYVNKATYDQALLLYGRFDGNPQRVLDIIKGKGTDSYICMPELSGLVNLMCQKMPEPLNMIAPFLIYATPNSGITWKADDVELGYGILHQLSQLIDFNATTLVPKEIRQQITLPTAILLQYKTSWSELCSTLEDKVVEVKGVKKKKVVIEEEEDNEDDEEPVKKATKKAPAKKEPEPVEEEDEDEDEEDDGIDWDALNAKLEAIRNEPSAVSAPTTPAPTSTPVTTSVPAPAGTLASTVVTSEADKAGANAVLNDFDV